jgi:hypothetical protein
MITSPTISRSLAALWCVAALGGCLAGCASEDKLVAPVEHRSPWLEERTWAVVPLLNESGVSAVDTLAISDDFVAEVESIQGVRCLPLNRSLAAMRSMGLQTIRTDAEARGLLRILQVDGLLVASVTSYDPYPPLNLGIAAQVYTVDSPAPTATDVAELTMSVTERAAVDRSKLGPSSQASRVYDASNHDVLARIARYAAGRHDPKSGMRAAVYTSTMGAYRRFVAYDILGELMTSESIRLGVLNPDGTPVKPEQSAAAGERGDSP